jgi:RNA polymerase sigma-70 factor (ECF subfamily)
MVVKDNGHSERGDITELLLEMRNGNPVAAEQLYTAIYGELRRIAAMCLGREAHGHTLQPTALVHEAILRLLRHDQQWSNLSHFFAVASRAMRRILVDHARGRKRLKRGEGRKVTLDGQLDVFSLEDPSLTLDLDAELARLEDMNPRLAKVVEMHHFGGLTHEEIAVILQLSVKTVKRDWDFSKTWLRVQMLAYRNGPSNTH